MGGGKVEVLKIVGSATWHRQPCKGLLSNTVLHASRVSSLKIVRIGSGLDRGVE